MVRKGISQTEKTGTVRNGTDSCRENFFACMMGKASIETEGKYQVTVEAIKND